MPDGLWEITKPLIPENRTWPQGGGTANTPDETLFVAIIYVLVGGCAWRALPPYFGLEVNRPLTIPTGSQHCQETEQKNLTGKAASCTTRSTTRT